MTPPIGHWLRCGISSVAHTCQLRESVENGCNWFYQLFNWAKLFICTSHTPYAPIHRNSQFHSSWERPKYEHRTLQHLSFRFLRGICFRMKPAIQKSSNMFALIIHVSIRVFHFISFNFVLNCFPLFFTFISLFACSVLGVSRLFFFASYCIAIDIKYLFFSPVHFALLVQNVCILHWIDDYYQTMVVILPLLLRIGCQLCW